MRVNVVINQDAAGATFVRSAIATVRCESGC